MKKTLEINSGVQSNSLVSISNILTTKSVQGPLKIGIEYQSFNRPALLPRCLNTSGRVAYILAP